jgi:F0F1-type ATP synthase assembly protein I
MSRPGDQPEKHPISFAFNRSVLEVAAKIGCLTLIIVLLALSAGLWLDNRFGTRPLYTIILILASAPLTFLAILWTVKATTFRKNPADKPEDDAF